MKKILITIILTIILAQTVTSQYSAGITVSLLEYKPQPVQPGQTIDVYLQVSNSGNPTEDTTIELVEEYPFKILETHDYTRAKHLGPVSSRQNLQFRIKIADDVKDGIVPLRVRYWTDGRTDSYVEDTFDINIQTFDASLDISSVTQNPNEIMPGEKGKLNLILLNNDDQRLENIDVVLDLTNSYDANTNMDNMIAVQSMVNARLEEVNRRIASGLSPLKGITPMAKMESEEQKIQTKFDAFAPVGSSNQKSIPSLKSYEQTTIEFDLIALPDITPGIYAVPIYINYNDEDNNPFHLRVDVPITVNMEPELYVELSSTTLRTTDFAGEVNLKIANRGLSELRYVTLELKEDNSIQMITAPSSIYFGNLKPGESNEGKFTLLAHEKNITIPLQITYRDSFNKKITEIKEIEYFIINKNYYRDLPYEMWLAWLILGGVILVLTIFFVHRMKKK